MMSNGALGSGQAGIGRVGATDWGSARVSGVGRRPAEVEIALKVLQLEQRQGYQDRAVTTGLASFLANWERRVLATGDAALWSLAEQVLTALDGYATLTPDARAARLDEALGLLSEESGVRNRGETVEPRGPMVGNEESGEVSRRLPLSR